MLCQEGVLSFDLVGIKFLLQLINKVNLAKELSILNTNYTGLFADWYGRFPS